jgi:hypothetical protein
MRAIRRASLALLAPPLLAAQPVVPESLDDEPGVAALPDRLQAQAGRLTRDPPKLQDLVLALRKQIVLAARPHPMEGRP